MFFGYAYKSMRLARDGVGKTSSLDVAQQDAEFLVGEPYEAGEKFVGIPSAEMYLHAGVATLQMVDAHVIPCIAGRSHFLFDRIGGRSAK